MHADADADLVRALQRGERKAFDRAYALFHQRIYAFLFRLAGRRDVADDLFQETFFALARHGARLREDTNLAAWLFTVARNAHTSYRRWQVLDVSRWVAMRDDGDEYAEACASAALAPDEQADATRERLRLEHALADLRAADREVLLLVGVEGLEQEEVAAVLGLSYDALRQRLSRARRALAALLGEREEGTS